MSWRSDTYSGQVVVSQSATSFTPSLLSVCVEIQCYNSTYWKETGWRNGNWNSKLVSTIMSFIHPHHYVLSLATAAPGYTWLRCTQPASQSLNSPPTGTPSNPTIIPFHYHPPSHCHPLPLSPPPTVTPSHCHPLPLSPPPTVTPPTVTPSHCHPLPLSPPPTVTPPTVTPSYCHPSHCRPLPLSPLPLSPLPLSPLPLSPLPLPLPPTVTPPTVTPPTVTPPTVTPPTATTSHCHPSHCHPSHCHPLPLPPPPIPVEGARELPLAFAGLRLQTFAGHKNTITKLLPVETEHIFISASRDKTVKLWSLGNHGNGDGISQPQLTYSLHQKAPVGLEYLTATSHVASCGAKLHVRISAPLPLLLQLF